VPRSERIFVAYNATWKSVGVGTSGAGSSSSVTSSSLVSKMSSKMSFCIFPISGWPSNHPCIKQENLQIFGLACVFAFFMSIQRNFKKTTRSTM
jgi:hypothetical protein